MLVSPQSLRTGNLALQHVTHSHPHGFMADTLIVVLTVPWVALLKKRPTHGWPLNTFYLITCKWENTRFFSWVAVIFIYFFLKNTVQGQIIKKWPLDGPTPGKSIITPTHTRYLFKARFIVIGVLCHQGLDGDEDRWDTLSWTPRWACPCPTRHRQRL